MRLFWQLVSIGIALAVLQACVTTEQSNLTRKADPLAAVQRYVDLGLEYIKRDDYNRARKHLSRALELDPDNAPALSALGLIYSNEGEAKLAEASFKQALDSDSSYTRAYTYYGAFLFSSERYKEALQQFEAAANDTRFSSRAQVYTNIALCNIKLGNNTVALDAYRRSLQLDRYSGRALSGATELLLSERDYAGAQAYYNRLIRLIAENDMQHSAQSLWQGIRIANYFNNPEQVESIGALLGELYPDSDEYQRYRAMKARG